MKLTRFEVATRFTGLMVAMFSSIVLVATGVISEGVWQNVMLWTYFIYAGADVGEAGITGLAKRGQS